MQVKAIGVQRRFGTSPRTQRRYDMASLICLTELRPSANQDSTYQASGATSVEYELDPTKIDQFLGLTFPAALDVETEARPSGQRVSTVIIGIKQK